MIIEKEELSVMKQRVSKIEEKQSYIEEEIQRLSLTTAKQSEKIININDTMQEILSEVKKFGNQITRLNTIEEKSDFNQGGNSETKLETKILIFAIAVLGISLLLSLGASMREVLDLIN